MMNFLACYAMMPALAYFIARALNLPPPFLAGCVLVGSINGGQASNLCTYIAKGDVALSVIMTTATTVGTIFMTPLIAKMVLGTVVSVDAIGIVKSTLQVSITHQHRRTVLFYEIVYAGSLKRGPSS
jgi:BASS family bile acid:Na+ symporter